jgi:hypothetical protein
MTRVYPVVAFENHLGIKIEFRRFQGLAVAPLAGTGIAHVRRPADQSDSLVTDSRQMLYCVERSQLIIGLNRISFEPRAGAHEHDDRNIPTSSCWTITDFPALAGSAEPAAAVGSARNTGTGGKGRRFLSTSLRTLPASELMPYGRQPLAVAVQNMRNHDGPSVVVVESEYHDRLPGYESWWDVPIAEVSNAESVQSARRNYEEAIRRERYFWPQPPGSTGPDLL